MSEPRRPDPRLRWQDRMRARVRARRDRWPRREDQASERALDAITIGGDESPSMIVTLAVAVAAAGLAIGGLWAWQSWSQRSETPIDERLPMLVDAALSPTDENEQVEAPGSDKSSDNAGIQQPGPSSVPAVPVVPAPPTTADAVVHVSGAVREPGVVDLPTGSRVFEAVELAGGPTATADLDRINLAAPIVDGERIHVPAIGEDVLPSLLEPDRPSVLTDGGSLNGGAAAPIEVLDINEATAFELDMLPGVGPSTAQAIVALRTDRGPFLSVDELLDVPGIGEAKLTLLRPHVVVSISG